MTTKRTAAKSTTCEGMPGVVCVKPATQRATHDRLATFHSLCDDHLKAYKSQFKAGQFDDWYSVKRI